MKILFITDVHFSTYSSILRKRGEKYSYRLENCCASISWAENLAEQLNTDFIVYGGDFFDKSELTAEETTALQDVYFTESCPHYVLVGNHEMKTRDRELTTAHLFNTLYGKFQVIDEPKVVRVENKYILFLPYVSDDERKPLKEYINCPDSPIVFSHNDIAGIQMGQFMSKSGFTLQEIESTCSLFINGHLHNGAFLNKEKTICNVGNLTGQNFSEDGLKYKHNVALVDTDALTITLYENPYAINFYKIQVEDNFEESFEIEYLQKLKNACVMFNVAEGDVTRLKQVVDNLPNIITYKVATRNAQGEQAIEHNIKELSSIDHITEFKNYVINQLGTSELLSQELQELQ